MGEIRNARYEGTSLLVWFSIGLSHLIHSKQNKDELCGFRNGLFVLRLQIFSVKCRV